MIIGGIDIIIPAPPRVPAAELILRRIRRLWAGARFIDAEEVESHGIDDPWVLTRGGQSREFLIYRDRQAMESWQRDGLTSANLNSMIHFILEGHQDQQQELTLVCDERTTEIEWLVADLEQSFRADRIVVFTPAA